MTLTFKQVREKEAQQVALTRQLLQHREAMIRLGLDEVSYVAYKTGTSLGRAEVLIEKAREES